MRRVLIVAVLCLLSAGVVAPAADARPKSGGAAKAQRAGLQHGKASRAKQTRRARLRAERRWRAGWKATAKKCRKARYRRKHKALCRSVRGVRGPRGPRGPAGPAGPGGSAGPGVPARADQPLRLLSINDLHGNLEPPSGSSGTLSTGPGGLTTPVGGAAYLSTHLRQLRAGAPNSLFVGNGDLIGASPLVSGLFHDEPTIEAASAMGMTYSSVGNHEFDEGPDELLRMQYGGCSPTDGCQDGDGFNGASFRYLAANVRNAGTSQTLFPPYAIKTVGGIKVAFIGLTLQGTPSIVTPSGVAGLSFDEESSTVNRLVQELSDSQGIESYVVMLHQGGQQNAPFPAGYQDVNGCSNASGEVFPLIDRMSAKVDVVLTAHTHQPYVCDRGGKLVTSGSSFGRLITDVDLTLDGATGDVKAKTGRNVLVTRDVVPDPAIQGLIDKYKAASEPIANRVVGQATVNEISLADNAAGESPLGDVIADSQLAATSDPSDGGAQIAFMNPGGIRNPLSTSGPGANDVTYADLYNVQPFANVLTVKTFTGTQLKALLEQQFDNPENGRDRVLQVSDGFAYSYNRAAPAGSRVDASSLRLNGTPITSTTNVRVTMNSFLATGGDGFTVFNDGTSQVGGDVDIDAAVAYFGANSPVAPGPRDRITKTG